MNPVKPSLKTEAAPLIAIALTIFFSFYFYSAWPDVIASHWNFKGEVDGYSSKDFLVWLFPAMMSSMYALFLALPYFDPKKKNYQSFSGFYHFFKALIITLFFLIYLALGAYNLGYNVNITLISTSVIGAFMAIIGFFMKDIKPNWFLGIRTPWTLSSDKVWTKTHNVGGKLFILFGFIIFLCNFLPELAAIILFIIGILSIIIGTTVYSYVLYNSESKKKQ